jgi:energy-coupling factor transporter ATP-binding protein EcfA2
MSDFIKACVEIHLNIVVSGGTGSGKTTTLNALSGFIHSNERIITVEDAAELQLQQDHVVPLETRPANTEGKGAVSIRDLIKNTLRMRPERIIVGECRGGESLDMLQAMNTGHDGSLTTGHSNSPIDMVARLETMVMMAGMDLPSKAIREQIANAVHMVVQQNRLHDGSRKITHLTEVVGLKEDGTVDLRNIFEWRQYGEDENGKIIGELAPTGHVPTFLLRFKECAIDLPPGTFGPNVDIEAMYEKMELEAIARAKAEIEMQKRRAEARARGIELGEVTFSFEAQREEAERKALIASQLDDDASFAEYQRLVATEEAVRIAADAGKEGTAGHGLDEDLEGIDVVRAGGELPVQDDGRQKVITAGAPRLPDQMGAPAPPPPAPPPPPAAPPASRPAGALQGRLRGAASRPGGAPSSPGAAAPPPPAPPPPPPAQAQAAPAPPPPAPPPPPASPAAAPPAAAPPAPPPPPPSPAAAPSRQSGGLADRLRKGGDSGKVGGGLMDRIRKK